MTKLFGTNGIRGVVNVDMNCELAQGIGKAWGTLLRKTIKNPNVAIATDARLSNNMLKHAITSGFLSTGCNVFDLGVLPTPALQYAVKKKDFDSGVIITASHNPPQFNGIKGVDSTGTEFPKVTEGKIERIYFEEKFDMADFKNVGSYSIWNGAVDLYIKGIFSNVDVELIRKKKFHVVLDCGSGVGGIVTPYALEKLGCKLTKLYCKPDGTFPGHNSEPIPENLSELIKKVPEVQADLGVAQDGDADRAIFVDENGSYIWGDKTLSICAKYITKGQKNSCVATPVTTSSCFDDVLKENDVRIVHTMVGSPLVARAMIKNNCIFGGEENGGLIFPEMQHTRDSLMAIAKILEIMAKEEKKLSELVEEIPKYFVCKTKISCPNEKKNSVMKNVLDKAKNIGEIISVDDTDGIKLYVEGGWVLMRASGTEPIFRVYAESKNEKKSQGLAQKYKKLAEEIISEINF